MVPVIPVPLIRRKVILKRFLHAGAIDAVHAVIPEDIRVNQHFIFSRLVSKGIIADAGNGRYYADVTKI